jgi:ketosteroid isomerase-like protein
VRPKFAETEQGEIMKFSNNLKYLASVVAIGLATSPVMAEENPRVAAEIMELARSQWAAEISQRPMAEQMSAIAEDYTEFNADHPTLLVGRSLNARLYEAWAAGPRTLVSDMQNARVQVYGDTAVLTYNYVGLVRSREGDISASNAKSTRVYARQNGRWMLVHANFSPVPAPGD